MSSPRAAAPRASARDLPVRALAALALALASCEGCGAASSEAPGAASLETPPPDEPLPPRPQGSPREWSPLGTNLDGPADWTEAYPFIDHFRLSRPWTSSTAIGRPDDDRPIDVDEQGWVRSLADDQIVRTGVMWDVETPRPGRYLVHWQGQGRLVLWGPPSEHVVAEGPHRYEVDWDPRRDGTGFGLAIVETDPSDPIRKIEVIGPGGACAEDRARWCDADHPCPSGECLDFASHHEQLVFDPDFLASLQSYRTVRFMNWQATNDSTEAHWSERPALDDARWSDPAVPVEIMLELSNRLGAAPWLSIPHRADDAYARELGRLVAERLDPGLPVHVELSNELWNTIFSQHDYAIEEGRRLGLPRADEDPTFAQLHWQARRSREVFAAFDEGFGEGAAGRVRHVIAGHAANPWVAEQMLAFEDTAEVVDELAIAPYFGQLIGPERRDEAVAGGLDALLAHAREQDLPQVLAHVRTHAALAEEHALALVAYEAGQHFVAVRGLDRDAELQALLREVNRDPRMGALYTAYLEGWREAGGQLLVHFVNAGGWGQWGTWGALEHPRQDPRQAPKYLALERFARTTPPWW